MIAALVGKGISRSATPAMHEAEGRAAGLNYSYNLIDTDLPPFNQYSLSKIVSKAQANDYVGLNITHPYKLEILQCLDELSDNARILGAVNTVVFDGNKKIGYNTDQPGFSHALSEGLPDVSLDKVLLIGAGGAGTAVAFALLDSGVKSLIIHDQELERSRLLALKLQTHYATMPIAAIEHVSKNTIRGISGLVNATPLGMRDYPGSAFPIDLLHKDFWVADVVYFPRETMLLTKAKLLSCRVMSGAEMAIWQAVHSFELFTGIRADHNRFHNTFKQLCEREKE